MASPHVPLETRFCDHGIQRLKAKVISGELPLAALCGDGVGACLCSVHTPLCLKQFMAMNVVLSSVEQLDLVQQTMKARSIPPLELKRLIQLNPKLQLIFLSYPCYYQTLMIEGEPWLKAFLTLDMEALKVCTHEIPFEIVGCVLMYQAHLERKKMAPCCNKDYCPKNSLKSAFQSVVKLPPELYNLIFAFV